VRRERAKLWKKASSLMAKALGPSGGGKGKWGCGGKGKWSAPKGKGHCKGMNWVKGSVHCASREAPIAEETSVGKGSGGTCRGAGPRGLLVTLMGLYAVGRLTSASVASLALQFLPILSQRAQRKQDKMNIHGGSWREKLGIERVLQRVVDELGRVPEAAGPRAELRAYVEGRKAARLGDALCPVLKVLAAAVERPGAAKARVAQALTGVADELKAALPMMFPTDFGPWAPSEPSPESAPLPRSLAHEGCACADCQQTPIVGPRFEAVGTHSWSLCCDCFAGHVAKHPEEQLDFRCHLMPDWASTGSFGEVGLGSSWAPAAWASWGPPPREGEADAWWWQSKDDAFAADFAAGPERRGGRECGGQGRRLGTATQARFQ
jgi:hypothetical protein